MVDAKTHKVVGTIPTGTGPRPGTISPDGRRVYMNVDELMGFLVIDTAARKVVAKAQYTLTKDEQAVQSRSHGIAVANDGKEVWSNDVVHNLTFVFDVTGSQQKQIARFEVGRQPYWIVPSKDSKTVFVACPAATKSSSSMSRRKRRRPASISGTLPPDADARRGCATGGTTTSSSRDHEDTTLGMRRRVFIAWGSCSTASAVERVLRVSFAAESEPAVRAAHCPVTIPLTR